MKHIREAREPSKDGGQACVCVLHCPLWLVPFPYYRALAHVHEHMCVNTCECMNACV